ncbi:MAG: hypothetical protein JSW51_02150 [Gemmatimonadota bacterium]|nr:MAG: hypothetical protein JSW51_02150 [Gemmatimonadota bacterium]
MSDYVISLIRTWSPIVAGFLGTLVVQALGVEIDTVALAALITSILSGAWYALARWLEGKFSWAGWLLGAAKQPVYPVPVEVIEEGDHAVVDPRDIV